MTTIAYSKGIMAGDTKIICHDSHDSEATKIKHSKDGKRVAGASGSMISAQRFLDWFDSPNELIGECSAFPEKGGSEGIIIYMKDGIEMVDFFCSYGKATSRVTNSAFAIGSGSKYALGAIYAGASALQAVEIACRIDVTSGCDIDSFSIY